MNVLTVIWNFVKKYWQVFALLTIVAVGYGWIRHQQATYADTLAQLNASHQAEIDQITQAKQLEEQQHLAEVKQLQDSINKINQDYAQAQADLAAKQAQTQQDIVKKYGNDAAGLAKLLADSEGFVVVNSASQ